jgi:hypothetical protein
MKNFKVTIFLLFAIVIYISACSGVKNNTGGHLYHYLRLGSCLTNQLL